MTRRIDRRQALGAFGTVSLGALLAACGKDRVETTDGGTATVEPETTTSPDTASRFGDESSSRDVRNGDDGIFDEALLLDLSREGDGYVGTIAFDVAAS